MIISLTSPRRRGICNPPGFGHLRTDSPKRISERHLRRPAQSKDNIFHIICEQSSIHGNTNHTFSSHILSAESRIQHVMHISMPSDIAFFTLIHLFASPTPSIACSSTTDKTARPAYSTSNPIDRCSGYSQVSHNSSRSK